jgi:hypothetical protein
MKATDNYWTFSLAQKLKTTVREMLTGQAGPLTRMEWYLWARFESAQKRIEQQQSKRR